jgi:hypothetical protein
MSKKENLVEDTFLQIKNLEESLKRNAQGILSSTMKEEIKSLVKESLNEEEDEEEIDVDAESGDEADLEDVEATDSEDEEDDTDNLGDEEGDSSEDDETDMMGTNMLDTDGEVEPVNMTQASDSELFAVFKKMKPTDGITVVKDGDMLHIDDENNDIEYLVQLGESYEGEGEDEELYEFEEDEESGISTGDIDQMFGEETIYEIEVSDDGGREMYEDMEEYEFETEMFEDDFDVESMEPELFEDMEEDEFGTEMFEDMEEDEMFEDMEEDEMFEDMEEDEMFEDMEEDEFGTEMFEDMEEPNVEDEYIAESSKFKAKGLGMGNASKFRYDKKPNMGGGFKTVKKKVNKTMGTGKAKFEYKEGVAKDKKIKKVETKEASRTLGNGKRWGREGLDKPRTAPRHLRKESIEEFETLRSKNQEYKKALDVFRNKLNEVAVFNSNLAYATRLFTEHSTTKQEKINILKRFDNVENLKESKNLYRAIKNELTGESKGDNTINESIERNFVKTPSTGSAVNLIESKTYENPQFLRMKDLMNKIK